MSYVMLRSCGLSSRRRRSKSLQMPARRGEAARAGGGGGGGGETWRAVGEAVGRAAGGPGVQL
jgi:hypothetical protein